MDIISQGEPYHVTANSELFISSSNVYYVRLLNKATKQYISCVATRETSIDDPNVGILHADFTAEQTKKIPVGLYSLEFVYKDSDNHTLKIDYSERIISVRMSSESEGLENLSEDNVDDNSNQETNE